MIEESEIEYYQKAANELRFLCADIVQGANSGHPGAPMGLAEVATTLSAYLRLDPKEPRWLGRDRLIFSGGHASALLYSLLHLWGFPLSLDDLKNFRKLGSKTPGHPEFPQVCGVEITTGPLGQGVANAVGFAASAKLAGFLAKNAGDGEVEFGAEITDYRLLAAAVNSDSIESKQDSIESKSGAKSVRLGADALFSHKVYCFCGDGDLQEGISYEAASFAGLHALNNLILIYDCNKITIEGSTDIAFKDDVKMRFSACGWEVLECDGHNILEINNALKTAQNAAKPVLLIAKTKIGRGAVNLEGSAKTHGAPLGEEEIALSKKAVGLNENEKYFISEASRLRFTNAAERGDLAHSQWEQMLNRFKKAKELIQNLQNPNLANFAAPRFELGSKMATRASNGVILNALAKEFVGFVGGSADLAPSNNTELKGFGDFPRGRNLHFGVREHFSAAFCNAMAADGLWLSFCATFFVFSDYLAPAVRVAAISNLRTFYIWTHDSIGVGEDGATHEPIEQLSHFRAMPNLFVFRPADANENAACWEAALKLNAPCAFVLSRQNLPILEPVSAEQVGFGAYLKKDSINSSKEPQITLLASGSEVSICLEAQKLLEAQNISCAVISAPCFELFCASSKEYQNSILRGKVLAIEAARANEWWRFADFVLGMESFGESGDGAALFNKFGFSAENIAKKAKDLL